MGCGIAAVQDEFVNGGRYMKRFIYFITLILVANGARGNMYSELQYVYDTNPVIGQGRADLDAARAGVDASKTELQPYLGITGNVGMARTTALGYDFDYAPMQYGLEFQQNVFQGGAMFAQVRGAQLQYDAVRANLRAIEQDVLMSAINAYIEVLNARAVMDLNRNNERVLGEYYAFVRDAADVGKSTQTDVAQASARLEMARYGTVDAVAQYENAIEVFRRIYGNVPAEFVDIDLARVADLFPESVRDATEYALRNHPVLRALDAQEVATRENIKIAYKSMLPSIDVRGAVQQVDNVPFLDDITDSRIGVYLRVPLYDRGNAFANADRVRANIAGIHEQIINARRVVVENLNAAWNIYQSQEYAINATLASVDANKAALDGVRDGQAHGRRTVLDVLNAKQELLNSRVAHTRAKHARIAAFFAVLASMGDLTPENLGLVAD